MAANPKHYWTAREFLAFEDSSEFKHELVDGEVRQDMSDQTARASTVAQTVAAC